MISKHFLFPFRPVGRPLEGPPSLPDFRKAGDIRVTCFPHEDRLSGFFFLPASHAEFHLLYWSAKPALALARTIRQRAVCVLIPEKLREKNPPFENQGRSEDAESGVKKRIGSEALPLRKLRLEGVAQNR